MQVSATDVDEGENQKITYTLTSEKFPSDIQFFRWDDKTGKVWRNMSTNLIQSNNILYNLI